MRGTILTLLSSAALLSCVVPALAQTNQLEDDQIIVTATRQAQLDLTYAGSIGIISEGRLEAISGVHPAETLNGIAGVNIHRGSGQEHLTAIRSPVLVGGAGAGSFLYLEDGVPLRAAGFANVNGLFETIPQAAQRIEVVKGPGSVLYGSNAVHGLINIIFKDPQDGGHIRVMGSDDGLLSASGTISSDTTRLSLSLSHDNGFRDASGFDQQKIQLRHDSDLGPWSANTLLSFQNLNQETAGFIQGGNAYQDKALSQTNPNPEAFRDGKSARAQVRLERPWGQYKTLTVTPYARWTDLKFLRHFVPGQALEKNGHKSIGLLTALYADDFIVGIDGEYTSGFLDEFQFNPSRFSFIQGAHYDYTVESAVLAGYAQKIIDLSPLTQITVGARAEYTDYDYDNKINSGMFGRFIRTDDRSDDFFTVTPKIGVTHKVSDRLSLYGRLARGSRAPQTSDLYSAQINQVPGQANVETLDSLEAGLKGGIGAFDIHFATYVMKKDNFFFRNSSGFNVIDGKTNHLGVEASFTGPLTDWLSISGDATWAKHTYNFNDVQTNPANAITDGDDVDTAPRTLTHMRLTARPTDRLMAEIEWRHVGSYKTDPGNTQTYPGHDIFVLRSEVNVSDDIKLFGRVDNLFDTRYADRADFAFGNERYFPGRPRTVFFGISKDF